MPNIRLSALPERALAGSDGQGKQKAIIAIVSVAAALLFGAIIFYVLKTLRSPKPDSSAARKRRRPWLQRLRSHLSPRRPGHSPISTVEVEDVSHDPETDVNRHTSVRSVATLPAYSPMPREGEGVIGREGDRAGMDTVLEFPETVAEEEGRREEEMESLWRIRQQRRQEATEREQRRRRRREARARGDIATLNAIRQESMLRTTFHQAGGSSAMIAEHHSRSRERKVSAVNYGDLGVARHDGSRVRANSAESDSRPLLDMSRDSFTTHHRMHSNTSLSSLDSDERPSLARDRSNFETISLQPTHSRAHSRAHSSSLSLTRTSTRLQPLDPDLGDNPIPLPDPPHYDSMGFEEAPPYEGSASAMTWESPNIGTSATTTTPPPPPSPLQQLPVIPRLPSIRITDSSPIEPRRTAQEREDDWGTRMSPTIHEETN